MWRQINFVTIYSVLLRNLFCCHGAVLLRNDLRAFACRKIYTQIVSVEKKGQISGMNMTLFTLASTFIFMYIIFSKIGTLILRILFQVIILPFQIGDHR